jgi:hypothetical protein
LGNTKYNIKSTWINRKMGTSRNLVFRVLCLKSSIPMKAPKGPKKASNKSLDSGTLQPPLLLFSLSIPNIVRETLFMIVRRTSVKRI